MCYAVFYKSAFDAFVKLAKVCPREARAHVSVMTSGDGTFRFYDWFDISCESIGVFADIFGKIMRDARLERQTYQERTQKKA